MVCQVTWLHHLNTGHLYCQLFRWWVFKWVMYLDWIFVNFFSVPVHNTLLEVLTKWETVPFFWSNKETLSTSRFFPDLINKTHQWLVKFLSPLSCHSFSHLPCHTFKPWKGKGLFHLHSVDCAKQPLKPAFALVHPSTHQKKKKSIMLSRYNPICLNHSICQVLLVLLSGILIPDVFGIQMVENRHISGMFGIKAIIWIRLVFGKSA